MHQSKGLFLVLEGGDGSGKSSQTELLADFFKSAGRVVEAIHFPRLDAQPYGPVIADFLRGEFGGVDAVHPRLAALLYALDRAQMAQGLRAVLEAGAVIIADRYLFSNIAYQCAKIRDEAERGELSDWIEKLEYGGHNIPRPDLTLYLDVPPEFSRAKLAGKRTGADRDYLKGGSDIHENSSELQDNVRAMFLHLAATRTGEIGVVDCRDTDGGMADKKTIHSRVIDRLRYYGVISH
jgi:dTMP kinase